MDDGTASASSRKAEVYRRAAGKKRRNIYGLLCGFFFVGIGVFINDVIIFGGALVIAISILNLYASLYAEKRLRLMEATNDIAPEPQKAQTRTQVETKECVHCKKRIPVSDKFCGECGKKLP